MKRRISLKRTIITLAFALLTTIVYAAKANPMPATIVQPDGKLLTIVLHGDEHAHYVATTDGVLLYREGNSYFVAKTDDDGELCPTPFLAHNAGQRTADELTAIGNQQRERFHLSQQRKAMRRAETLTPYVSNYFPHEGTPHAVVILAQFSDLSFKHDSLTTYEIFDQLLNAEGKPTHTVETSLNANYGSVRKYFTDMSYGAFTPQFDIYGPITLPGTMKSYGKSENIAQLMKDACGAIDEKIDFTQYDSNGDGQVDLVYVIYAGHGECYSNNSEDFIWPKAGSTYGVNYDGINIIRYGVHCELGGDAQTSTDINGIGLFCHEFSHTLGLPDLYTNAKPADDLGMEDWDLMDGGEYLGNNIGCWPCEYSPWEREVMGWSEMQTLTEAGDYELLTLDQDGAVAYRIPFEGSEHEYLYLHNVQQRGWNQRMRGHGMLAVHVMYNTDIVSSGDHPNSSPTSSKRLTIHPADGYLMSSYTAKALINEDAEREPEIVAQYLAEYRSDPFPGTLNVTQLTDESEFPPVTFNDNLPLGKPILDIAENRGVISFTFLEKVIPMGISDIEPALPHAEHSPVYDLQGRRMKGNPSNKGIYIIGNKKYCKP